MHLVQFLLPLNDNQNRPFPHADFDRVFTELTETFGGATAYQRSPAQGAWKAGGSVSYDEVIVFEVMVVPLDRGWWQNYRQELERRFRQESVIVRASEVEQL